MRDQPFILPLTDDPNFIPCKLGDVLTDEQYDRMFPGFEAGMKMLAERFFADPANQPVVPQPTTRQATPGAGAAVREGAAA